jgi:hypothetical protein
MSATCNAGTIPCVSPTFMAVPKSATFSTPLSAMMQLSSLISLPIVCARCQLECVYACCQLQCMFMFVFLMKALNTLKDYVIPSYTKFEATITQQRRTHKIQACNALCETRMQSFRRLRSVLITAKPHGVAHAPVAPSIHVHEGNRCEYLSEIFRG